MDNKIISPDRRLALAASFVRRGCVCADIGADHAYTALYLVQSGICERALITDLRPGPLSRARINADDAGLSGRTQFFLADGLHGVPLEKEHVSDILICGMGGELTAKIIAESPYPRTSGVHLILQPMSSIPELRLFLDENGFDTLDESICSEGGRLYQCILCAYDGLKRTSSPAELAVGKINIRYGTRNQLFKPLLAGLIKKAERCAAGLRRGGADPSQQELLIDELSQLAARSGIITD